MGKVEGYFTVEAAMLFPFVTGIILLVIYMLFFQYDRCLMEQSAATLSVRGCALPASNNEEVVAEVLYQESQEDKSYIAWGMDKVKVEMKGNKLVITRGGFLKYPFSGLLSGREQSVWQTTASYSNYRIRPVRFIRSCRKISGGK